MALNISPGRWGKKHLTEEGRFSCRKGGDDPANATQNDDQNWVPPREQEEKIFRREILLGKSKLSPKISEKIGPIGAFLGLIGTDSSAPHSRGDAAEIPSKKPFWAQLAPFGQSLRLLSPRLDFPNSGSIHPYGRYGNAGARKNHIYHSDSLACQGQRIEKRAAMVEGDTFISQVFVITG